MNPQINRVFGAIAIGFALLIALTTYWQVWAAPSLAARQDNRARSCASRASSAG